MLFIAVSADTAGPSTGLSLQQHQRCDSRVGQAALPISSACQEHAEQQHCDEQGAQQQQKQQPAVLLDASTPTGQECAMQQDQGSSAPIKVSSDAAPTAAQAAETAGAELSMVAEVAMVAKSAMVAEVAGAKAVEVADSTVGEEVGAAGATAAAGPAAEATMQKADTAVAAASEAEEDATEAAVAATAQEDVLQTAERRPEAAEAGDVLQGLVVWGSFKGWPAWPGLVTTEEEMDVAEVKGKKGQLLKGT